VTLPRFEPRRETEPAVDLAAVTVLHRAQRTDTRRLADVAGALDHGHGVDARRVDALQEYLSGMRHCIQNSRRINRDVLVPMLLELGADIGVRSERQRHDDVLVALLSRTEALLPELRGAAAGHRSPGEMRQTLDALVAAVEAAVAIDERTLVPLVRQYLTPASLHWVQAQCHRSIRPQLLPFIVPWLVSHATETERETICSQAPLPVGGIMKTFGSSFLATRQAAFG
jgi:hypothetical protein